MYVCNLYSGAMNVAKKLWVLRSKNAEKQRQRLGMSQRHPRYFAEVKPTDLHEVVARLSRGPMCGLTLRGVKTRSAMGGSMGSASVLSIC